MHVSAVFVCAMSWSYSLRLLAYVIDPENRNLRSRCCLIEAICVKKKIESDLWSERELATCEFRHPTVTLNLKLGDEGSVYIEDTNYVHEICPSIKGSTFKLDKLTSLHIEMQQSQNKLNGHAQILLTFPFDGFSLSVCG